MRLRSYTLLISLLAYAACTDKKPKRDLSKKLEPIVATFALEGKSEASYYYTIHSESEVKAEVNGQEVANKNISDIDLVYRLQKDSTGNGLLRISFDKMHFAIDNQGQQQDFNTENGSSSYKPMEQMLAALKGAVLTAKLDKKGKLLSISGYDSLLERVMLASGSQQMNVTEAMRQQVKQLIGEELIRGNISETMSLLPDSTVYVGDSWERVNTQTTNAMPIKLQNLYTFEEMKDGMATITSRGMVTAGSDNSNLMGLSAKIALKGKQQASYTIETKTGMALQSNTTMDMQGTLHAGAKEIPITIKTKKEIKGRKL